MTVIVRKDVAAKVFAATKLLTKTDVLVGIPASENARDDGPIGNAALGYLHDTGSPANNIPARPFMGPGIAEGKSEITRQFRKAGDAAMRGDKAGVLAGLTGAGIAAENAVKKKITEGPFVPLSEKTIKARQRRGRTGIKPLIDTGQLRRSITHVLRTRNAKP